MRHALWASALAALSMAACSQQPAQDAGKADTATAPAAPVAKVPVNEAPPGAYKLDRDHASLTFRVNHMGLSRYTARFTDMSADLQFDPANPSAMTLSATVDPRSLETDFHGDKPDFDAELAGPSWLDAAKFPQITFKSTKVEVTGPATANVTGDLSLHGVTRPVTLKTTFNGGAKPNNMDPMGSRIGFSAEGSLKRSEFGVAYGIPAPGSNFGVGDEVEFFIEAEFTQPAATPAAPAAPAPAQ
jgi:polyisoprenoid-binding protein YceI